MLQPRLWPDEVQFGLASSTTSQPHIVSSAVKVGALLDAWPIMGGYGGILKLSNWKFALLSEYT